METTSTSLLMRLREPQDGEAWSRFVELYTPLIFFWARQSGLQPADAADLVQDVLTILVRKLPTFQYDARKSFRGWLRTITLNKWRERARRGKVPTVEVTDSELGNLAAPDPAEAFWETDFKQQLVARAVELMQDEFQPTTWQACRQYVLGDQSADDVAAQFGISVWTVYSAKSRLLKRLREELDGMLD